MLSTKREKTLEGSGFLRYTALCVAALPQLPSVVPTLPASSMPWWCLRCTVTHAAVNVEPGQPYWIRTSGLQLRRLLLYPTELRAAVWWMLLESNQPSCSKHVMDKQFMPTRTNYYIQTWWAPRESNTAPTDYESAALTNMS